MPTRFLTFTTGTRTLLGTTDDESLELSSDFGFDTILSGDGEDSFAGTDRLGITEKFYGGRDDDFFHWSRGINLYHGGQPDLPYAVDGKDRLDYSGVGTVTVLVGQSPVPHLSPDFLAYLNGGSVDKLFSINALS